ncbi:MAG: pyridoxamine 5'-phosphate oxidase family protein [Myxococcales bacterium]|nr:pyridoxamine 5'-phosphate oxidase family protein [Myxococcales bacterium]
MPNSKTTPKAQRPAIAAGYLTSKLLAWPWAESRLIESRNYWIATLSPNGRPRARPVWGVWLHGKLNFSTGSLIRRDLNENPCVSVNLESGDECVIVEGTASELLDPEATRRVSAAYNLKYNWDMEVKPGEFFAVSPRVAFGWLCDNSGRDGGALFSQTATRWSFGD